MRLTVLGCYGPYPPAGQSCSGYLLTEGDTAVLLDCGNGVLSKLRYHREPWELDAVILSHLHSDHVSDLLIMRYAMMIRSKDYPGTSLQVYAPNEPAAEFSRLAYKNHVSVQPIFPETKLEIGRMTFTFSQGVHPVPSYFITAACDGRTLVYSGDTEFFPEMATDIRGANLFLCEANYSRDDIEKGYANHLAAYQAAAVARDAGIGRLVLTHHHPERDGTQSLAEARAIFANTELARAGSHFLI